MLRGIESSGKRKRAGIVQWEFIAVLALTVVLIVLPIAIVWYIKASDSYQVTSHQQKQQRNLRICKSIKRKSVNALGHDQRLNRTVTSDR